MSNKKRSEEVEHNSLVHKTWRGHNKEWIFKSDKEKEVYLKYLNRAITLEAGELNALCMMSNHIHEIYRIGDVDEFSRFMRKHHSQFGIYYNHQHIRRGPVSESRPKLEPITSEKQQMIATFYVHTNPLRAKIVHSVEELKNYTYSTHLLYGYGIFLDWMKSVTLPHWYLRLGQSSEERQKRYLRELDTYIRTSNSEFQNSIILEM